MAAVPIASAPSLPLPNQETRAPLGPGFFERTVLKIKDLVVGCFRTFLSWTYTLLGWKGDSGPSVVEIAPPEDEFFDAEDGLDAATQTEGLIQVKAKRLYSLLKHPSPEQLPPNLYQALNEMFDKATQREIFCQIGQSEPLSWLEWSSYWSSTSLTALYEAKGREAAQKDQTLLERPLEELLDQCANAGYFTPITH